MYCFSQMSRAAKADSFVNKPSNYCKESKGPHSKDYKKEYYLRKKVYHRICFAVERNGVEIKAHDVSWKEEIGEHI